LGKDIFHRTPNENGHSGTKKEWFLSEREASTLTDEKKNLNRGPKRREGTEKQANGFHQTLFTADKYCTRKKTERMEGPTRSRGTSLATKKKEAHREEQRSLFGFPVRFFI